MSKVTDTALATVTSVRWEPCSTFQDDPADCICAGCGFSPDEHLAEAA